MLKHLVTGHIHLMKKWTFRQTYLEATGGPRPEQEQRSPPPPQASQSPSPFVESDQLYAQQTHLQVAPIQYEAPPKPSFAKFSDDDDDNDEQYEAAPLPSDITHERTVVRLHSILIVLKRNFFSTGNFRLGNQTCPRNRPGEGSIVQLCPL